MYSRGLLPPTSPHKSNFHQYLSIRDFYVYPLHFTKFLRTYCQ